MELLWEFNKKYLGHSDYDPKAAFLGKLLYDNYLSLSAISNDICTNDAPSPQPPLLCEILCLSFGRPSANHSFYQEARFKTTYVLIIKSGFFPSLTPTWESSMSI
jgi:hypothetical protein